MCVTPDTDTRDHHCKLVHPSVRINVRQHFFAIQSIPVWNFLSPNVVSSRSMPFLDHNEKL